MGFILNRGLNVVYIELIPASDPSYVAFSDQGHGGIRRSKVAWISLSPDTSCVKVFVSDPSEAEPEQARPPLPVDYTSTGEASTRRTVTWWFVSLVCHKNINENKQRGVQTQRSVFFSFRCFFF